MTKRVTQAKSDPTMLLVLAAIGLVGLFVTRRYGLAPVLRTVNQALGIARVVRSKPFGGTAHPPAARAPSPAQGAGLFKARLLSALRR